MEFLKKNKCMGICTDTNIDGKNYGINGNIINCLLNNVCYIPDQEIDNNNIIDLMNNKDNLPVYIIQAHGSYIWGMDLLDTTLFLNDNDDESFVFNNNRNTYIVDTTPLCAIQQTSKNDNINVKAISENTTHFKNELFSDQFNKIFDYKSNYNFGKLAEARNYFKFEPILGPPKYSFPNKKLKFHDNNNIYEWDMGIYEAMDATKNIKLKNDKDLDNKTLPDKIHRTWNGHYNIDKLFSSKNQEKGARIRNLILDSIKNNKSIYLQQIVNILGDGIYVLLTCSKLYIQLDGDNLTPNKSNKSKISKKKKYINNKLYEIGINTVNEFIHNLKYGWNNMVSHLELPQRTRNSKIKPYLTKNKFDLFFNRKPKIERLSKLLKTLEKRTKRKHKNKRRTVKKY
jgi:hypothetical protein